MNSQLFNGQWTTIPPIPPPEGAGRAMASHAIKSWPDNFRAVVSGRKRFEVRKDDRSPSYQCGDVVTLHEFDPFDEAGNLSPDCRGYTGKKAMYLIGFVSRGPTLPAGWCAFELVSPEEANRVALALRAGVIK